LKNHLANRVGDGPAEDHQDFDQPDEISTDCESVSRTNCLRLQVSPEWQASAPRDASQGCSNKNLVASPKASTKVTDNITATNSLNISSRKMGRACTQSNTYTFSANPK
ncbi:hypothetical protein KC19_1G320800, partial [Ceratodon purpureus]